VNDLTVDDATRKLVPNGGGTVSDRRILGAARRLRTTSYALEAALYVVIAGSALAIGAVHPWAYVPLWFCAALMGVLVAVHALSVGGLRRHLGLHRFAFHVSGRWLLLDPAHDDAAGWGFDLSRPAWPRAPLLWPGVAFLAWAIVQVIPLPEALVHMLSPGRGHLSIDEVHRPHPLTIDAAASLRGIAFAGSMLAFHLGATAVAERPDCRRRFRTFVAWFGAALALIALVQIAVAARRIYGFFQPLESTSFFGVFVNRNHFAAYMTLCAMAALAILYRELLSYVHRLGGRTNLRRQLVTLGQPEGVRLVRAVVPVLLIVGALVATTSRGGILSFAGALVLASVATRRHRHGLPVHVLVFLLLALPLAWFGLERIERRFGAIRANTGRVVVWRHSVASMSGTWLTGAGLNTFAEAISRVVPFATPAGATAWPHEVAEAIPAGLRIGHRTSADLAGWHWYDEAHNDYVQLAVEMGAAGVAIGIWALSMLAVRMREPWLAAGVAGILIHSTVDFSLQIPAVAVLFLAMCSYAERTSSGPGAT
jgi:hypothetical protein